ncbi:MAG: beta-ketoacyl-ACP synthase II [Saprospiraceae bacterium]|uniref:3-oxoacyl-[acyl-carrier-protein] synthase 2 n=1 Tax=Candidatus Opimibacter skivensis TaxID=2982028 RepID=A0A9D7XNL0_9BACT|nr:beta-ketoacyl-ACP synthase II [Candidatus Opimibacter skivensis]
MSKRVVITGMGALTPIGNNLAAYLEGLKNGANGAGPITRFDATGFRTTFACEVKNFNPEDFLEKKESRRIDPFSQFALVVADEAIADSGLDLNSIDKSRVGVIWGSGIGGFTTFQEEIEEAGRAVGVPKYSPFLIPKLISNIAPGHISIKYGFSGVNLATVSACASANHALIIAADNIRLGRVDVVVTGGSEAAVTRAGIGGFSSMKALSTRNDDVLTASRPFDKDRDGFVLGEGGGALILESYEYAKARGARIYAELIGSGMNADAYHITAPEPTGKGVIKCMEYALQEAGMNTGDIDYINVHGTSTPLGDVAEPRAIQAVFGDDAYKLNISSTKSMMGHLLGAAGAVEAIASILAINHGFIPPTINHFTDDPEIDGKLNFTFNEAQARDVKTVMSNGFGFGGHNTSLIFGRV